MSDNQNKEPLPLSSTSPQPASSPSLFVRILWEIVETATPLLVLGFLGKAAYNDIFYRATDEVTKPSGQYIVKNMANQAALKLISTLDDADRAKKGPLNDIHLDIAIDKFISANDELDSNSLYLTKLFDFTQKHPLFMLDRLKKIHDESLRNKVALLATDTQTIIDSIESNQGRDILSGMSDDMFNPILAHTYRQILKLPDAKKILMVLSKYPHGDEEAQMVTENKGPESPFHDEAFINKYLHAIIIQNPALINNFSNKELDDADIFFNKPEMLTGMLPFVSACPSSFLRDAPQLSKRGLSPESIAELTAEAHRTLDEHLKTVDEDSSYSASDSQARIFTDEMDNHHILPDATRFADLKSLSPAALIRLVACVQDQMYTSTFLGISRELYRKLDEQHLDLSIFMQTKSDRKALRNFMTMAIGYGQENVFIKRFADKSNPNQIVMDLMDDMETDFFDRESRNRPSNEWKIRTDVSTVYEYMSNCTYPELREQVEEDVVRRYQLHQNPVIKAAYGYIISSYLSRFPEKAQSQTFLDSDTRPEYSMPDQSHIDTSKLFIKNVCAQRIFFYDDDAGKSSFNNFIAHFKNKNNGAWSFEDHPDFIAVTSAKANGNGRRIVMIANKPEAKDNAQGSIDQYIKEKNLTFTVAVLRSHSYDARDTLKKVLDHNINPLLFLDLGCGGTTRLSYTQKKLPNAQIIVTSQVGTELVNNPLQSGLNAVILNSPIINWDKDWPLLIGPIRSPEKLGYRSPNDTLSGHLFQGIIRAIEKQQKVSHVTQPENLNPYALGKRFPVHPIRIGQNVYAVG